MAYDQLTSSQKKDLHLEAACVIESVHGSQLVPDFAILAHHWTVGGEAGRHCEILRLGGHAGAGVGGLRRGGALLQTCLEVTERDRLAPAGTETLVRWHRALADVHQGLGQVEMRGIEARRALALAGRARPPAPPV